MSERLFPLNTAAGTVEFLKPKIPRLPELVDAWGNYLEYWAQTGGMDIAGDDELAQAHQTVQQKAEELLLESAPGEQRRAVAYSNLALAAAQDIRQQALEETLYV